jgi:hypothetical protein
LGGVFYDEGKTIKEEEEKKSLHARAKSRKKSEKERNTHTKIFPPCIISLLYQAR